MLCLQNHQQHFGQDSRTNLFEEKENDEMRKTSKDPVLVQAKICTSWSLDNQQHYIHLPIQESLVSRLEDESFTTREEWHKYGRTSQRWPSSFPRSRSKPILCDVFDDFYQGLFDSCVGHVHEVYKSLLDLFKGPKRISKEDRVGEVSSHLEKSCTKLEMEDSEQASAKLLEFPFQDFQETTTLGF